MSFADHDAYIAAAAEQFRPVLQTLRGQLANALNDADEIIAYNMPGFAIGGDIIAGYAAFSSQCGLYVAPDAIRACSGEITAAGLKHTKTGVTFPAKNPLPETLIRRLAQLSRRAHGH